MFWRYTPTSILEYENLSFECFTSCVTVLSAWLELVYGPPEGLGFAEMSASIKSQEFCKAPRSSETDSQPPRGSSPCQLNSLPTVDGHCDSVIESTGQSPDIDSRYKIQRCIVAGGARLVMLKTMQVDCACSFPYSAQPPHFLP